MRYMAGVVPDFDRICKFVFSTSTEDIYVRKMSGYAGLCLRLLVRYMAE